MRSDLHQQTSKENPKPMDAEIKREFDKRHRELKALKADKDKATWVSVSWILEVTGWTKRKLQAAREQKIVEYKDSEGGGYLYKLESIPEQFIKQKQAS
jgi:hypothetical protein